MAAIVQQRAESDSSDFELQREVRLSDTGGGENERESCECKRVKCVIYSFMSFSTDYPTT